MTSRASPVLVGRFVAVPEQQATGALEVAALTVGQLFLYTFADAIHGLRAEAGDMKTVNDDLRVGKEGSGHIPEAAVYVHDHVSDLAPVGEGTQIIK